MLGSVTMTPQLIEMAFPIAFLSSHWCLRRYRDPLLECHETCLHLAHGACEYYDYDRDAHRDFRNGRPVAPVSPIASSVSEEIKNREFFYILYTLLAAVVGTLTLVPAIFYVAYHLRQIRHRFHRCRCTHSAAYHHGSARFRPPAGCEDWIFRDGGYDRPDRLEWVRGVKISPSSPSSVHA
jgi:hypothetical protein